MKLTESNIAIEDLVVSPEQLAPRTQGIHVSSIIQHISQSLGRRDNDFSLSDLNHFALLGRVFEVVLAQSLFQPPRYERLGELERDGIIGSPDAFDVREGKVAEFKCTWKSSSHDVREFREYWWQIQSYCHMAETQQAELVILHICGDWKPPVPCIRHYIADFTKAELRQNWQMLLNNAGGVA